MLTKDRLVQATLNSSLTQSRGFSEWQVSFFSELWETWQIRVRWQRLLLQVNYSIFHRFVPFTTEPKAVAETQTSWTRSRCFKSLNAVASTNHRFQKKFSSCEQARRGAEPHNVASATMCSLMNQLYGWLNVKVREMKFKYPELPLLVIFIFFFIHFGVFKFMELSSVN